jgi:hypothetical protein
LSSYTTHVHRHRHRPAGRDSRDAQRRRTEHAAHTLISRPLVAAPARRVGSSRSNIISLYTCARRRSSVLTPRGTCDGVWSRHKHSENAATHLKVRAFDEELASRVLLCLAVDAIEERAATRAG